MTQTEHFRLLGGLLRRAERFLGPPCGPAAP